MMRTVVFVMRRIELLGFPSSERSCRVARQDQAWTMKHRAID